MIVSLLQKELVGTPDGGVSKCKGPGAGKRSGVLGRAEAEVHGKELSCCIWEQGGGFKWEKETQLGLMVRKTVCVLWTPPVLPV